MIYQLLIGLLVIVACAGVSGCFATTGEKQPSETPFDTDPDVTDPRFGVFVPERVDAVLGERVVVPVELAGAYRPEDVGLVQLDDGRRLETQLVWLTKAEGRGEARGWLPVDAAIRVVQPDAPEAGVGLGQWIIVLDPPIDAVGQGVWLAGRRAAVNWLPDPREVALRVPSSAWSSPLPAGIRRSASLQRMLEPLRVDPYKRWQVRLVSGDLTPSSARPVVDRDGTLRRPERVGGPEFDETSEDAVREAIASFTESRWLVALARLYEVDPDLNLAVRQQLSSVVDFGEGAIAPVWSTDRDGLGRLLDDLTDQSISVRERGRRAEVWLNDQPKGVAWVLSDAGRRSINGEPLTTVGLLNATWDASLASLEPWSGSSNLDLQPIPRLSVQVADVISRPAGSSRAAVVAQVGVREFQLLAGAADLRARPPGLRIDALFRDLTLDELLQQRRTTDTLDGTNALLYLDHRGKWVLYVECRTEGRTPGELDRLTISLGAAGSEREAQVVAGADGIVGLKDRAVAGSLATPLETDTASFEGGWSLRLTVPDRFLEGRRTLRMGIERSTDRGVRSAWPRAMLPWQSSPPRAAIDLSTWDD